MDLGVTSCCCKRRALDLEQSFFELIVLQAKQAVLIAAYSEKVLRTL